MLDTAWYVALSSVLRKESRGTFYRDDFPQMNNEEWKKIIELTQGDEEIEVNYRYPEKLEDFYI